LTIADGNERLDVSWLPRRADASDNIPLTRPGKEIQNSNGKGQMVDRFKFAI
jgi:hypothetical protein